MWSGSWESKMGTGPQGSWVWQKGPLQYKDIDGVCAYRWAVVNPGLAMCVHSKDELKMGHGPYPQPQYSGWRQEDKEVKASLSYLASLRPVWATWRQS